MTTPRARARDRRPVAAEDRQRRLGLRHRAALRPHDRPDDAGARADGDRPRRRRRRARGLSGVSQPVRIDVRVDGPIAPRVDGALLWTHFGVSGPAALDVSRHWLRARLEGAEPAATASLLPGRDVRIARSASGSRSRARRRSARSVAALAGALPASVAAAAARPPRASPPLRRSPTSRARRGAGCCTACSAWPLRFRIRAATTTPRSRPAAWR